MKPPIVYYRVMEMLTQKEWTLVLMALTDKSLLCIERAQQAKVLRRDNPDEGKRIAQFWMNQKAIVDSAYEKLLIWPNEPPYNWSEEVTAQNAETAAQTQFEIDGGN